MIHPYQLLPPLDEDAYRALKADIAERGVLVPVEIDETGTVLDGHHRIRAWQELRAEGHKVPDYPRAVRAGLDELGKRQHVRALNLARRHLSQRERRALVADAIRDDPAASDRRIAAVLGVSPTTVGTVRAELVAAGDVSRLDTRTDTLGREQPATKPAPAILVRSIRDERRARDALATIGDEAPGRFLDLRAAERMARTATYRRRRETTAPVQAAQGSSWELRAGDFGAVLDDLAPGSVGMVLCDPPYVAEFDDRWADLGALSARVLYPGGVAIFYSGHHNLPSVIDQLGQHLVWCWHVVVVQPGHGARINSVQVHNGHRDLLVLTNGPRRPERWLRDTLTSGGPDKTLHEWQQSLAPPTYLVDVLCPAGGLVLDPCCGSGTFGVAALAAGRRFLGVDVDPVTLALAAERLAKRAAP